MPEAGAWCPMYWADYLGDTMHLGCLEHGAYLLLIANYWRRGKPIPDDDRYLANATRLSPKKWKMVRPVVEPFFQISEGLWRHKRVESELLKSSARLASARSAAKAGGLAKAQRVTVTETVRETPPYPSLQTTSSETGVPPQGGNGIAEISKAKAKAKATAESRGTRLPEDWEPGSEGIEYARDLGLSADQIRAAYGAFMRHWLAKAGAAGRKLRWDLTWQTWVRNDYERIREKAERERQRTEAWPQRK